jgi:acyl-coenzyme A synthetase/AMP-(fatty) acid ligase
MLFSIDDPERQDRVALVEGGGGRSWSYRDLAAQVERLGGLLRAPAPSLLFLFCRNDLVSVAWYLAAIEAGHAVALLNDRLETELRENLISRYSPDWVCASDPPDGVMYGSSGTEGLWRRSGAAGTPLFAGLSLLLSTSGSTGSPKFVRLTKANVLANAASIREALGVGSEDRPAAHLPIHYSYGLSVVNSHLLAGASILLTDAGLVSHEFWDTIRRRRVDSFSGVPYTYQMLRRLGLEKVNAPSLRIMTQAGGKLDTANISYFHERMLERNGTFWVMYGQTEATARISILHPRDLPRKLGTAGRAIPGGTLSIRTDSGELTTAAGVEGELVYSGPNVMLGYALERADLAKGDELGGRLYTGDRAVLDDEGFVQIFGRAKRDAKVFGLRLNLDELEAFIRPKGPAAAVAGGNGVVIFCEFGDPSQYGKLGDKLGDELAAKLRIHRSAFEFRRIDRLPTKDTGKIGYEELQGLI